MMRKKTCKMLVCFSLLYALILRSGFYLKAENGMIGVWNLEDNTVYPTGRSVAGIESPEDQKMLQNGIYCENRIALTRAMEDFCS